jgi:hypothetical protein
MQRDARGLPVSGAPSKVIDAIDRFTLDFLDARDSAGAILDLAERHHDCALVQCYAAAMHLYSQSRSAIEACAAPLLARARASSPDLTERERLLLEALEAWARGDLPRAIAHLEELTGRWPRDIVAGKFGEFLFFEAPDYARHLRFMERMAAANAGVAAFHAMHSFALELAGRDERAEAVAHEAIRLERDTPWAHHTLGHLHLNQGRLDEGIAVLHGLSDTWSGHSRSMRTTTPGTWPSSIWPAWTSTRPSPSTSRASGGRSPRTSSSTPTPFPCSGAWIWPDGQRPRSGPPSRPTSRRAPTSRSSRSSTPTTCTR